MKGIVICDNDVHLLKTNFLIEVTDERILFVLMMIIFQMMNH